MDLTTLLVVLIAAAVVVALLVSRAPNATRPPAASVESSDLGKTGATFDVSYFRQIRDDAVIHVVGEAYRQELVAKARPPGPDDLPPGMPPPPAGLYKALLVAQPTNPHDRNAIMVLLWSGGTWAQAGYLSREDAVRYQPVLAALKQAQRQNSSPPAIVCDAALIAEREGTGVVLHLGTPGECAAELATDERAPNPEHPWAGKVVAYTGQESTTLLGVPIDRRAQIMLARWAGCDVIPRLTRKAHALVAADPSDMTGNLQKAQAYGLPVLDEREFLAAIGIPTEMIGQVSGRWTRG